MINEVLLKVISGDVIVYWFKQQSLAASHASMSSQSSSAQDIEHFAVLPASESRVQGKMLPHQQASTK